MQKHILNRYIYDFNVDDEAFSTDLIETINTFPHKKKTTLLIGVFILHIYRKNLILKSEIS